MDGLRCMSGSGSYGEHRPLAVAVTAKESMLEHRRTWTKLPCRWPSETTFHFIGFVLIEMNLKFYHTFYCSFHRHRHCEYLPLFVALILIKIAKIRINKNKEC